MTIYLHAGTPKTGTTSVQQFLLSHKDFLAEQGYRVMSFLGSSGNHTKLAAYAMDDEAPAQLKADLKVQNAARLGRFRSELEETFRAEVPPEGAYVASNEHCVGYLHSAAELERLKHLLTLTGHEVKVIIYFREPADYLASTFSTNLKVGAVKNIFKPHPPTIQRKYNYLHICRHWSAVFGKENVVPRLFIRDRLVKGDIVLDFLSSLGMPRETIEAMDYEPIRTNTAMDYLMAGFLREMNQRVPRQVDGKPNRSRGDLGDLCQAISHREGILVPEAVRDYLYEETGEDLALFNEEFMGGAREWPFPPYKTEGRKPVKVPDAEEMLEITAELWAEKVRRTRRQ